MYWETETKLLEKLCIVTRSNHLFRCSTRWILIKFSWQVVWIEWRREMRFVLFIPPPSPHFLSIYNYLFAWDIIISPADTVTTASFPFSQKLWLRYFVFNITGYINLICLGWIMKHQLATVVWKWGFKWTVNLGSPLLR